MQLKKTVWEKATNKSLEFDEVWEKIKSEAPPTLSSQYKKEPKDKLIKDHVKRFPESNTNH